MTDAQTPTRPADPARRRAPWPWRRRARSLGTPALLRAVLGAAGAGRRWGAGDVGRFEEGGVAMAEGARNGRVLLEFAAKELRAEADAEPDPFEVALAVSAVGQVLAALARASRALGVAPPALPELGAWAMGLVEQAPGPPHTDS